MVETKNYTVHLLINNEEVRADKYTEIRDPGRLTEVVGTVALGNANHVERAVQAAHKAFPSWRQVSFEKRSELLLKAADLLEEKAEFLVPLMARETGILLSKCKGEIPAAAEVIRSTVHKARAFLEPEIHENDHNWISIEKVPLGVIAALPAWNVPIAIAMSKVAPILITGNTVVVKPSPNASIALSIILKEMAELFPPGVINIIHGGAEVGSALTSHPLVRKISLTGGGSTASQIMRSAADSLKRVHFELGGNDPAIILDDANLQEVIPKVAEGAFSRSGQVCVAMKRIYIPEKLYKDACDLFVHYVNQFKIGYELDANATFGPVNNKNQYYYVKELIEQSKQGGAKVLELGEKLEPENWENGYYISPTVVLDPDPDMDVVTREQFGPVVPLVCYRTIEEVIYLANNTEYGLGSTVWTTDTERGLSIARQIEAGMTGINGTIDSPLGFLHVPFGGVKQSGIGWERGEAGLREFVDYHGITHHKTINLTAKKSSLTAGQK